MGFEALNLRHLRALAAIVRLGSVSAAAQAVNITQPAITQGLRKLEQTLQTPLFERRPDGMSPLPETRLFAERIERAVEHIGSTRVTMAQLRAVIALADEGSYPAASAATGLAQPSLHRSIGDLQVSLRKVLIERRGRGIAFTEAGRKAVRQFRLARAELRAGLAELEAIHGLDSARIAIGAMPLCRARLLPAAAAAFHAAHPDVKLSIAEGAFAELVEPLRDGEIDLMIGAIREPAPGADIEQRALFVDRPVIIGRRDHPLAGANPDIAALARYAWIVPSPSTPLRAQWEHMFTDSGHGPPEVPIECGSVMTIRQLLLDGDLLTLLSPDQVRVELEAGWLTIICDTPTDTSRTIGISTRADWRPTASQQAFLRCLDETVTWMQFA